MGADMSRLEGVVASQKRSLLADRIAGMAIAFLVGTATLAIGSAAARLAIEPGARIAAEQTVEPEYECFAAFGEDDC